MLSFPPKNIVSITVYEYLYQKNHPDGREEVSAHEVSIPYLRTLYDEEHGVLQTLSQNCVSKCSRLHLSAYSFQKISGGHTPGAHLEARSLQPLGTSPPDYKS